MHDLVFVYDVNSNMVWQSLKCVKKIPMIFLFLLLMQTQQGKKSSDKELHGLISLLFFVVVHDLSLLRGVIWWYNCVKWIMTKVFF